MNIIKISCHIVFIVLICQMNFSELFNKRCNFELTKWSDMYGPSLSLATTLLRNSNCVCYFQQYSHKKFLRRRIVYTRNGTASFNPAILVLSLSGDIHPNPGPLTPHTDRAQLKKKNNANHNDAHSHHPTLCSDLPSGLRITQWNLQSLAPRINNTKLD